MTETQTLLVRGCAALGLSLEETMFVVFGLQDEEEKMIELMLYMAENRPSPQQILRKANELMPELDPDDDDDAF